MFEKICGANKNGSIKMRKHPYDYDDMTHISAYFFQFESIAKFSYVSNYALRTLVCLHISAAGRSRDRTQRYNQTSIVL